MKKLILAATLIAGILGVAASAQAKDLTYWTPGFDPQRVLEDQHGR